MSPSSSAVWKASWDCSLFPLCSGTMLSFVSSQDKDRAYFLALGGWLVPHLAPPVWQSAVHPSQHLPLLPLGEPIASYPQKIPSSEGPLPTQNDGFAENSLTPVQSNIHQDPASHCEPWVREAFLRFCLGLPYCPFLSLSLLTFLPHYPTSWP